MLDINDYNYDLPNDRIAKHPIYPRDEAKLLLFTNKEIREDRFLHISDYLPSHSLLLYNDTRVIHARLSFQKVTGAHIEILCLTPLKPFDYQQIFETTHECSWKCIVGNAKRLNENETLCTRQYTEQGCVDLHAQIDKLRDGDFAVHFMWTSPHLETPLSFAEILSLFGKIPIPPYLHRESEPQDSADYQTIYANIKGSVAAPTAGLHFTEKVLDTIREKDISIKNVTLHVGAGTFKPVKVQDASLHPMHAEFIEISRDTIQSMLQHMGNITAVGTTTVRTIESLYFIGEQLHASVKEPLKCFEVSQSCPYEKNHLLDKEQALINILNYMESIDASSISAQTKIMIRPGYTFHYIDRMITNFHQPKSTLLLLVSAFVGDDWRNIYQYAMDHDFRFLSYGDCTLLSAN